MNSSSHVPPGFRFHPTDEELVDYYLRKKVNSTRIDLDVIKDVDLYKIEPWDLQELCSVGTEEQNEWYFFSHKDKKYPTGTRTNRATAAGFWKATGRDKAIYSKHELIGMRKTLVFYKGRAPNGLKSDWIMHEYRLQSDENDTPQEEGWVVCRVFKKRVTATATATAMNMNMRSKVISEHDSPTSTWYDDHQLCVMQQDHDLLPSPKQISHHHDLLLYHHHHQQQQPLNNNNDTHYLLPRDHFLHHHHHHHQLPLLHTNDPKMLQQSANPSNNQAMPAPYDPSSIILQQEHNQQEALVHVLSADEQPSSSLAAAAAAADWRLVDKFVSSQLISQQDDHHHVSPTQTNNNNNNASSTSNSSSPMDLVWK